jgi:Short C-terminal domain
MSGMVVVFGFGAGRPDDLGEIVQCVCPNCHNQVFLHHVRSKKSVRLYFVPVVPYGTNDYLVCPVCSQGLQLGRGQLRYLPAMSGATASFRAGRLSQAQYQARAGQFLRQLGLNSAGQPPPPAAAPAASPAGATAGAAWISEMRELSELHDQGVLSDDEFAAAKRRVLGEPGAGAADAGGGAH